jgi:hypothetical protein
MPPLQALFLAPMAGVAATVLPVFWLNLAGLPVGSFARPLFAGLILATTGAWLYRRPNWTRSELIFFLPVIIAIIVFGFASLKFGFDWVANANDDWANYNLSAIRYLHEGYYQQPSMDALRGGRDYPEYLWFLTVASDGRPGSDLLLAWLSGVTGKNPFYIFMPLILTFHAVFCLASAGLAANAFSNRRLFLAVFVLTALAPLSLYAVHQQLIAQTIGLAFMCGTACLTFVPLHQFVSKGRIAFTSIIVAAYWLVYPETAPFFVVAFAVFHILHFRDENWGWRSLWKLLLVPAVAGLLLGPYTANFFFYLLSQIRNSSIQGLNDAVSIFPFFLVPSGLTVLFGLSRLGELYREPFLSMSIAAALFLSLALCLGAVQDLFRRQAIFSYIVTIASVAVFLLFSHNDFGIFKLAMYAQAFIWFAVFLPVSRFRSVAAYVYVLQLTAIVVTDVGYTSLALSDDVGSNSLLVGASRNRLLTKLLEEQSIDTCDANFDTPSPPLVKLLSARRGCARMFVARPDLFGGAAVSAAKIVELNPLHRIFGISQFAEKAANELRPEIVRLPFDHPIEVLISKQPGEFTKTGPDFSSDSIYSGSSELPIDTRNKASHVNELVFLNSNLGGHYYLPDLHAITSLFQTQPDVFFPDKGMAAIGRYLLFRINSPAKSGRLSLDITTSILGDGNAKLPPAVVIGEEAVPIGLVGHGAGRVTSPTFSPKIVDGIAYILLDLGVDATLINVPRSGLMKLYGRKVALDYRRIVAYARGIRFIDSEKTDGASPPSKIDKFPNDLANKNLEFSGIYEDGWLGDEGFVTLASNADGEVVFRGKFVAGIGLEKLDLTLSIVGGPTIVKTLERGDFVLQLPATAGLSRIKFQFSKIGRLPGGDDRPATALLDSVSIESSKDRDVPVNINKALPKFLHGSATEATGIFSDGWLSKTSSIEINSERSAKAIFGGMVPGGIGLDHQEIVIKHGDNILVRKKLEPGSFTIEAPLGAGHSNLAISFAESENLPAGDGRNVAALLQSFQLVPDSP